jgi:hypothetical protein
VAVDKQKQRLEELDETDEALEKQYLKISQKEYIAHIEKYVGTHQESDRPPGLSLNDCSLLIAWVTVTTSQVERGASSCVGERGEGQDSQDRHSGPFLHHHPRPLLCILIDIW